MLERKFAVGHCGHYCLSSILIPRVQGCLTVLAPLGPLAGPISQINPYGVGEKKCQTFRAFVLENHKRMKRKMRGSAEKDLFLIWQVEHSAVSQ
jgi:hypothetical protein